MPTFRDVSFMTVSATGGFLFGLKISAWWEARRRRHDGSCCGGTGFADYAAAPCENPHCPEKR